MSASRRMTPSQRPRRTSAPTGLDLEPPLVRSFFARDADVVARELIGKILVHGNVRGRIVETEAYFGPPGSNPNLTRRDDLPWRLYKALMRAGDPASHSFPGMTQRNRVMFGPAGHAYVYVLHGHHCMNISTGLDSEPQAVLLRGTEVEGPNATIGRGPGRLTRAFGITREHYGHDMTTPPLYVADGPTVARIAHGPRVNVSKAAWYRLRFADPTSESVSRGPPLTSWPPRARRGARTQSRGL